MAFDVPNTQQAYHFHNWAETFDCTPDLFVEPEDLDDLKKIVEYARTKDRKIKVIGNGHSPSDIACTDDIMIDMKRLNRLLELDHEKLQCTVEAGMMMSELNQLLHENQMALPVLPSISDVTMGGAIAVSTHSSGINYGTLSSYVVHLEVLCANGLLIECSAQLETDIFRAACCSLGAIGIITKITFQCDPAFHLKQEQKGEKLDSVLDNLDSHLKRSEHFKFFWYPHTDNAVTVHLTRVSKPKSVKEVTRQQALLVWLLSFSGYLIEFLYWIGFSIPSIVPLVNRFGYWLSKNQEDIVDISYKLFNYDCLFKQYVTDWAIPIENTGKAIREIKSWLDNQDSVVVHFPMEVRFCKGDDIYISPAFGRDTAYLNIIMYRPYGKDVPKEKYWKEYEKVMEKYGGRPHWAKEHNVTSKKFQEIYPHFEDWCRVRETLDPNGMFINRYIQQIISD